MAQQPGVGRGGILGFVKVRVMSIDGKSARVLDDNGGEYQVPMGLRTGKGGFPRVDDIWLITKMGNFWVFSACVGKKTPPLITAPRDGADRLTVQILDALLELGLVEEEGRRSGPQEDG